MLFQAQRLLVVPVWDITAHTYSYQLDLFSCKRHMKYWWNDSVHHRYHISFKRHLSCWHKNNNSVFTSRYSIGWFCFYFESVCVFLNISFLTWWHNLHYTITTTSMTCANMWMLHFLEAGDTWDHDATAGDTRAVCVACEKDNINTQHTYTQVKNILLYLFLGLFHSFILIVQLKIDRKCGENKWGMTCIKGPKVRFAQPSNVFFF